MYSFVINNETIFMVHSGLLLRAVFYLLLRIDVSANSEDIDISARNHLHIAVGLRTMAIKAKLALL